MEAVADVDLTGRTVDHYAILALIQGGAQGRVYRGRDEWLHRDVAIKVLTPDAAGHRGGRHGLIDEARTLSRLNHPHVAGIYDFVSEDDRDFMVMEFVPGATLAEVLAGGPLPPPEVARLGGQLARGLAAAHAAGILHCDIKPANLKVTSAGALKILDFGIAKRLPAAALVQESRATTVLSVVGTVPYMAPEVLCGERADERSDVFGAGAVLYEMATGVRAFPQRNLARLVEAVRLLEPRPPSELTPALPAALEAAIARALQKAPAARFQSAAELAAALDALLSNGERRTLDPPRPTRWWRFGSPAATASARSAPGP